ncbi:hypothetical protein [Streptomyces marianii]|uniref:Uncharacterized protein n=1 Tax=Streptomyces marianii TaxID=1817406 RepID=A0A5R9E0Q3_9ACTN|nr:hypothetical protein [Streptomyces marianii]TLQ43498.1 hypothetical protein FEF34_10385 [Streptomyces marianii]
MTAANVAYLPTALPCRERPVPTAQALSWEQYAGRACCSCGKRLTTGAVHRGVARGRQGVHVLDVEVWSCP